jgi:hypothetical protein
MAGSSVASEDALLRVNCDIRMHVCMYVYIYMYTYVMYIHIYAHILTYLHTYICARGPERVLENPGHGGGG